MWVSKRRYDAIYKSYSLVLERNIDLEKQNNELFFKLQEQIKKNQIKFDGKYYRNRGQFAAAPQKEMKF